ncbi:MAG: sporulation transcriptional regulator SpoIIID [Clostridia bacterium]|nr:sporulation transcriptional regulator SpoIIID [Clostridia bacterium]
MERNGGTVLYYCKEKIYAEANYILEHRATVRETAQAMGVGKSTVHKDVTTRLSELHPALAKQVREILNINKAERHIRGGKATHDKYAAKRQSDGVATQQA